MNSDDLPAFGSPTIPTFIAPPGRRSTLPEQRPGDHVAGVVHAEVGPAERERARRAVQRAARARGRENARAAANEVVAWALGNDSRETVGRERRQVAELRPPPAARPP